MEASSTAHSIIEHTQNDPYPRLLAGLEVEFGSAGIESLAERFLEAETADFHWEARISERHLGSYVSADDGEIELDRIAVAGCIRGRWYVATFIVDGDGAVHDMSGLRQFERASDAQRAFDDMR